MENQSYDHQSFINRNTQNHKNDEKTIDRFAISAECICTTTN